MSRKFIPLRKPWVAVHAKGITHGRHTPVRVVLHDTESHDTAGITDIEGIYSFWERQGKGYGAHFVIDGEGNIGQGAAMRDMMWHVGRYNTGSIGIEQIGFASYTKLIWNAPARKQLRSVAKVLAWLNHAYDIPLSHNLSRGICTHADVGKAGIDTSGHTDPGTGYPLSYVLWLAKRFVKQGGWYEEV